jgi:Uma2 family endonuclease
MGRTIMSRPIGSSGTEWTYDEYARFPDDGNRYEVLDGEVLVTPKPTPHHQYVSGRLFVALRAYVEAHGLGHVFFEVDLLFVEGQFLAPDLLVVPPSSREGITTRGIERPPALVVEILSRSSRKHDRIRKPSRYLAFGVPEYWVVDPFEGVVWVWTQVSGPDEPRREAETLRWQMTPDAPELVIDVAALVAPL